MAPFIENKFLEFVPYYVFPTLGTSLLAIGTGYWLVWAKVLPAFGYHIQHEIVQMPDGSERVKYKVSPTTELFTIRRACSADVLVAEGQAEETEETGAVDSATETICLVKRGFNSRVGVFDVVFAAYFPRETGVLLSDREISDEIPYGKM